jgi:cell wall-associated NlpC family hydrolase
MVGRLPVASLLALVVAALAAPAPVTAQPARLFLTNLLALGSSPAAQEPAAAPAPAPLPETAVDAGEYGVEYQLSVRDAESFLDRLSAGWKRRVEQAMTYLGTPYRRGGTSRHGLDCSGLVGAVYGEEGLGLPRTAARQFGEGVPVAEGDLRPGDLVFFRNTYKRGISHVGIYIGDGHFVHAAGHRRGVVVSELSRPYYHLRYAGARRLTAEPPPPDVAGRPEPADRKAAAMQESEAVEPAAPLPAPEPAAAAGGAAALPERPDGR